MQNERVSLNEWREELEEDGGATAVGREETQKIMLYIPIALRIVAGSDRLTIQFFLFLKRANKAKENSLRPWNSRSQTQSYDAYSTLQWPTVQDFWASAARSKGIQANESLQGHQLEVIYQSQFSEAVQEP